MQFWVRRTVAFYRHHPAPKLPQLGAEKKGDGVRGQISRVRERETEVDVQSPQSLGRQQRRPLPPQLTQNTGGTWHG